MAGPPVHFSDIFPTVIESLFYGIYCVLFVLCIYVLCTRKGPGYKVHLGFMILLFSLPTADIFTIYAMGFDYDWTSPTTADNLFVHTNTDQLSKISKSTFLTSNLLADTLILYRCYMIWDKSWRIMILPILVFLSTIVSGFLEYSEERSIGISSVYIFMATTFTTNVVVVSLTAARIWWLNRRAGVLLGASMQKRCKTCVNILLETGAIYPAGILIAAICVTQKENLVLTYTAIAILKQLVGIGPTLILVRAGLGAARDTPNSFQSRTVINDVEAPNKSIELQQFSPISDRDIRHLA